MDGNSLTWNDLGANERLDLSRLLGDAHVRAFDSRTLEPRTTNRCIRLAPGSLSDNAAAA